MSPSSSETVWPSASSSGRLSRTHASAYLKRIKLPQALLDASPSLDLLRQLQAAHMLSVPFESLSVHVPDWHDLEAQISLGGGETVKLGEGAYRRIVELRRGGWCFTLNSSFASLLRYFGFRVSECAARVFMHQRKDPTEVGWDWESTSHQVSIVDWDSSDERWLVDVGFGSSCAYPIALRSGAVQTSIPSADLFTIEEHARLPGTNPDVLPDSHPYWVVSRRAYSTSGVEYYSPCCAFLLQSVPLKDFETYNHWQSTSPTARFFTFFVATLLREDGERITLQYMDGMTDDSGNTAAKFTRTSAPAEGKREEELEKAWVEMRVKEVRKVLEERFQMSFPAEYGGN
ncbi:hypothetical protein JCM10213_007505 [Rhodosporidiobolus nylandii]